MNDQRGRGNGVLYLLLSLGVLMVLGGFAVERMPSLESLLPEESAPEALDYPYAPEPYEPEARVDPTFPDLGLPAPVPPPAETRRVMWHAEAQSVEGLPRGTPCVLAVDMDHGLSGPMVHHAVVQCADRVLFDGAVSAARIDEVPFGIGGNGYRVQLASSAPVIGSSDTMLARTGMHTIDLSHDGRSGSLFVEDLSVPVHGPPFTLDNQGRVADVRHPLRLLAIPTRVEGDVPLQILRAQTSGRDPEPFEPTCELSADAVPASSHNCRLLLRCDGAVFYGRDNSGYNDCELRDGSVIGAHDAEMTGQDTDPRVVLDLGARSLVVADDEGGYWSVTFELARHPRCDLGGDWRGIAVGQADARFDWTLSSEVGPSPVSTSLQWVGGPFEQAPEMGTATIDCETGRVELSAGESPRTYELFYGPGFRTLAGGWWGEGAAPGAMWGSR